MRLRTILKIVGILLVAVVVSAVAYVLNLDPNNHKDRITAYVEKETGRKLSFDGVIDLDIGSTTKLVVRDVTFANAEWAKVPQMLSLERLELDVRILPLLSGYVDIERLFIRGVNGDIEFDNEGRSNLDFLSNLESDQPEDDSSIFDELPFEIAQFRLENVNFDIVDGRAGTQTRASIKKAIAEPGAPGDPLDIDIEGSLRLADETAEVDLSGRIGSWDSIFSGRQPVPVNLTGTVFGLEVEVDGGVRQPQEPDGFDVSITVLGDAIGTVDPFITAPLPDIGPLTISARISGKPLQPVVEGILVQAEHARLTGRAEIDLDDETIDYDLSMTLDGQSLGLADAYVDLPLKTLGPVDGVFGITGNQEGLRIDAKTARVGQSSVSGGATVDFLGEAGAITYDATFDMKDQSIDIARPFLDVTLPVISPMTGKVRMFGDLVEMRFKPEGVQVENVNFTGFLQTGLTEEVSGFAFDVSADLSGQVLTIVASYVDDLPDFGPVTGKARLRGDDKNLRLDLENAQFQNASVNGKFTTGFEQDSDALTYDLSVTADGQSLAILDPIVDLDFPDIGPITGNIAAKGTDKTVALDFDPVSFEQTALTGSVTVDTAGKDQSIDYDLVLDAKAQRLGFLKTFVDFDLPQDLPIDLTAIVKGDEGQFSFENLVLQLEDSDLKAQGRIVFSGVQPDISGTIDTVRFDSTLVFPDETPAIVPLLPEKESVLAEDAKDTSDKIFPADLLPLDFLRAAKIDVALKAGELVTPYGIYRSIDSRIVLDSDVLSFQPLALTYRQSDVQGEFKFDARAEKPLLVLNLQSPNLQIGQLLKDFVNLDVIEGKGTFDASITGSGHSIAEIVGSLDGDARLLMSEGRMRNEGLGFVSGLFSGIGEVLNNKQWVAIECLASDFDIAQGIATSKVGVLKTEVIELGVSGDINLATERYNLKIKPSPRGFDLSLAVPIDVRGPLSDPSFRPNTLATLTKLGALLGSVLFPPAALIGLTELGGSSHPCVQTVRGADGQKDAAPSKPVQGGNPEGAREPDASQKPGNGSE